MTLSYLADLPLLEGAEHACPSCQGVQSGDDILELTVTETREIQWICSFCGTASPVYSWEVCV